MVTNGDWRDSAQSALADELMESYGLPEENANRLAATLVEWSLPQYGDED